MARGVRNELSAQARTNTDTHTNTFGCACATLCCIRIVRWLREVPKSNRTARTVSHRRRHRHHHRHRQPLRNTVRRPHTCPSNRPNQIARMRRSRNDAASAGSATLLLLLVCVAVLTLLAGSGRTVAAAAVAAEAPECKWDFRLTTDGRAFDTVLAALGGGNSSEWAVGVLDTPPPVACTHKIAFVRCALVRFLLLTLRTG